MISSVLDASALLAWLLDEPGAGEVLAAVEAGTAMTTVNAAEVWTRLALAGADAVALEQARAAVPFPLVDFAPDLALRAARLAPATRRTGLSLGDRACLALAQRLEVPALTCDRVWSRLEWDAIHVGVRLVRS